jgi:ABC-type phosphate transport system substrate-binding protein
MATNYRARLGACFLLMVYAARMGSAQEGQFAVVVNSKSSVTNIPLTELRKIFLGERRFWPGSHPVKLLVRAPGSREHKVMLKLLGMTESEYKQYWTQQVFRGEAQAEPVMLMTDEAQLYSILHTEGAIALIDLHALKPGMKVVNVDNLMPGAKDYPLHE